LGKEGNVGFKGWRSSKVEEVQKFNVQEFKVGKWSWGEVNKVGRVEEVQKFNVQEFNVGKWSWGEVNKIGRVEEVQKFNVQEFNVGKWSWGEVNKVGRVEEVQEFKVGKWSWGEVNKVHERFKSSMFNVQCWEVDLVEVNKVCRVYKVNSGLCVNGGSFAKGGGRCVDRLIGWLVGRSGVAVGVDKVLRVYKVYIVLLVSILIEERKEYIK
jgi:hypothetical protein